MDLSTNIAGVHLKYPILASAGPLTKDAHAVRRLGEVEGIGAAIIKTVCTRSCDTPRPYMSRIGQSLLNYDLTVVGADVWLAGEFERALKVGIPLVVSLYDDDVERLLSMAKEFAKQGAAMIEMPVAGAVPLAKVQQQIQELKTDLTVPLVVKVGPDVPNVGDYALGLEAAGVDVIAGINSLSRCLGIDIETGRALIGNAFGAAWLSGEALKPVALYTIAEIARRVKVPVWGGGGVANGRDAIAMIMAGASCVFMQTAPILKGLKVFGRVAREIEGYLVSHGFPSTASIRGMAQQHLAADIAYTRVSPRVSGSLCNNCGACERICLFGAVHVRDGAVIDSGLCDGCGLCLSVCPTAAMTMVVSE